ncbi:branched-chain amino acid ABC transporter permease [Rhizobium leguminosarum]|uniref:branched-chain amino acid ABC transporter permease n=1 Tax=Rhizobium leguminosarum TaxID=384 RepID=UPI001C9604D8|nr:branched-chain amino acid ABC transporter permease [Rhizobium leguminosarum]MBY5533704.1 branched-chain amino acid ABC transporter permease [Rhizobium leguminosarum]
MQTNGRFPDVSSLLVAVFLIVLPLCAPVTLASQLVIFAIGTLSVTVLLGTVGLLSFGQGLYMGFGAYAAGIMLLNSGFGLLPALAVSAVGGAGLACIAGFVIVRQQGVYFVMLTLALAQMGYFAMLSMKEVTGGENGLTGLPRELDIAGISVTSLLGFYGLAAAALFLTFLAVQRLIDSPLGSVLTAIKDNESRSAALGYDVRRYKIVCFTVAGGIAGLSGGLHAVFLGFVPPNDIEIEMSQRLLVMAIIGGVGSPAGAIVGAGFYTLASELLSELWARWMALIAIMLVAIVLFLPGGLWSIGERLRLAFQRGANHD